MAACNVNPTLNVSPDKCFSDKVLDKLSEMQKQSKLTDFCVKVKEMKIACHRCVLTAGCPYFETLFESGMKEVEEGELCWDTMNEVVVETIIQYLYGREISIAWSDIMSFLDAVELLSLHELKIQIDEHISAQLQSETCLEWYYLADRYRLTETMKSAKETLTTHFSTCPKALDLLHSLWLRSQNLFPY